MIGLCKKLNMIYNIITCNPEPQENSPGAQTLSHEDVEYLSKHYDF